MFSLIPRSFTWLVRCSTRRCYSAQIMIDQILAGIAKEKGSSTQLPAQSRTDTAIAKPTTVPEFRPKLDNTNDNWGMVQNRNNRFQRPPQQQRHKQQQQQKQQHQQQLEFTSGSDRLQQLFLHTFKKIKEFNARGRVMEIQPLGVFKTNILTIFRDLDLDKEGVELVKGDNEVQGEIIPLVKIVDLKRVGQLYADYLHEQLTLNSGLLPKGGKKPETSGTKEGKLKQYKLSWNLSLNDLVNVKLKEIYNQILKNNKVEIYLGEKRDLRIIGDNFINDKEQETTTKMIDEIERIKRDKIVDTILQFIEQQQQIHKILLTQRGSTVNRVLITLKLEKPIAKKSKK